MRHAGSERVPCKVIAPYIRKWIQEHGEGRGTYSDKRAPDGVLSTLSGYCGVSSKTLRDIKDKEQVRGGNASNPKYVDHISLSTADKILCGIGLGLFAWQEDDLAPYYSEPLAVTKEELLGGYELPVGYELTPEESELWHIGVENRRAEELVAA